MDEFKNELIDAIVEVTLNTDVSLKTCISTAKEMLREEKER